MGRHRIRLSTLRAETQSAKSKTTHSRPTPISLQDVTTIRRQQRCPKCQGWVMVHLDTTPELRCINCGWRPQYDSRTTTESETSRWFRQATRNLLQDDLVKKGLRGGNDHGMVT